MQRIVLQYWKEIPAASLSHSDVRGCFLSAAEQAGFPVEEGRRSLLMGPPLPPGATSQAEQSVLELTEPRDPADVCQSLNRLLPTGVHVEQAWVARPGNQDGNPSTFGMAVYDIIWVNEKPMKRFSEAINKFLAATEIQFTRTREEKVQKFNARALVQDLSLVLEIGNVYCLRLMAILGSQGNLRPDELLKILGCTPSADSLKVHRVALLRLSPKGSRVARKYFE